MTDEQRAPMNWHDAMKAVAEGKMVRCPSLGLTVMLRNGETHKRVGKYYDCYWLKYCAVNATAMEATDWEVV